ncbi:MAG: tetratricopeptide repeat protein, partial [Planctomycetes bacterium]|nr:tetratricopeptide repeat protein [Planctomycetota bacterium]
AGSFCAGFILVPMLGKESSLSLVTGLQLLTAIVAGIVIFRAHLKNILKLSILATPAVAGIVLCFYFPVWDHVVLSRGKYHRFEELDVGITHRSWLDSLLNGPEILTRGERGKLVFYGEGIGGFTTVLKFPDPLGHIDYVMANSGKSDASSKGDMETQTLSAHLPMLFHKDAKSVMVLGLASGVTAGEILYYPVERLDVIDISHQVVAGSDFFIPWNNNVLSNERTNLIIQDGRAHLQLSEIKYDVVISEPSNPWMAGLAALFTRDFFELAHESLNDDGIFVQFIHSYQMDWPSFSMVGRTFAEVFDNSLLISTIPGRIGPDYLLVGFKGKDGPVLENARENLSYIQDAQNVGLVDARLLYRLIVAEDLEKLFGPGPVNTDIEPHLEFAAPKLLYQGKSAIVENIKERRWLSPETEAIVDELKANVDSQIDFATYALSIYSPFKNMVDLAEAESSQKQRFFSLMGAYCAKNPVDYSLFSDKEIKEKCASLQIKIIEDGIDQMPDRAFSYMYLGLLYNTMDMVDRAEEAYNKSLEIRPDVWDIYLNMATMFNRHKQFDRAIAQYNKALQINPGLVEAHVNIGMVLAQRGQVNEAADRFLAALRIDPQFANAYNGL